MFIYKKVGFRTMEESDLEILRQLRNHPSTWMNLNNVEFVNVHQQKRWFKYLHSAKTEASYTAFYLAKTEEVLGRIRIDNIDRINRSICIGVDILPDKRNQGWGTKIYNTLLYYLFMHQSFHRAWLSCLEDNKRAINLYLRLGFKKEGKQREAIWRDGKWHDCIAMSILEDEYRNG